MEKVKGYIKAILIPVAVGGLVGLLISGSIGCTDLVKPPFSPPSIVFPIVWTILYFLMGISDGILKEKNLHNKSTKTIYYLQLFVNALWSVFFFTFKWRLFSCFWIVFLDILVILMIIKFIQKDKTAGLLQLPYLFWSLFATYLNIGIYLLNG